MQLDVSDIKPRIYDLQISGIMNILAPSISAEGVLLKSTSLSRRTAARNIPASDHGNLVQGLNRWFTSQESSLFILKAGFRADASANCVILDVINMLQTTTHPVLWVLSQKWSSDRATSTKAVLQDLIYQALQKDSDFFMKNPELINAAKYHSDHSEQEWFGLLGSILARLPQCFVIIETHDLFTAYREQPEWFGQFLALFQTLVDTAGTAVKVLLVSYNAPVPVSKTTNSSNRIVTTIRRPTPLPPSRRHIGRIRARTSVWDRAKVAP